MFELWDLTTNNMVDTFPMAIDAEYRLSMLTRNHGESSLGRFFLSFEREIEAEDALVGEGDAIMDEVRKLAEAERLMIGGTRRKIG